MRATATMLAFLLCTLAHGAVRAQSGDDEPLDIGMPPDDEQPPDGEEPPPEEEPVVRDPAMAKKLADGAAKIVKAGDKLMKKKKVDQANAEYARAIPAYLRAFELNPEAKLLVIVGALEEKLQMWFEARGHYAQAMAETEIPLDDKLRAKAQTGIDNVSAYLGVVSLVILPEGAAVLLDGADIGPSPLAAPLVLKPGEYTLAVSADGFLPLETKLVVDAGSESERSFELEAEPVKEYVPPPPPPPPPPPVPPAPSKLILMVGAGTTLAFTIGAITTGIIAVGKHNTFADPEATDEEKADAQSSGPTMAVLTDAFTTVALLAAGATVYYYLKIYSPKAKEHDQLLEEREEAMSSDEMARRERRVRRNMAKVLIAPSVQEGGGGLVVAGWF